MIGLGGPAFGDTERPLPMPPVVVVKVSAMSITQREALERRIDEIANRAANAKPFIYEDSLPIHIKSSFDPVNESLIMNTDERLGPSAGSPDVEDMQSAVRQAISPLIEGIPSFWGVDWRYGGKDIYFWFPQDRVRRDPQSRTKASKGSAAMVLVSAGHGYYYHHGYSDWRAQRAPYHGILEDNITTRFASSLSSKLRRIGVAVTEARPPRDGIDELSGQPYDMLAARYRIKELLPERVDIWHSLPDDSTNLREYKEDIRSRPLYANALGVDAVVHLHTNAAESPAVRGTKVFFQSGQADSARLGSMILCYMREQIHSLEGYRDFPVATAPEDGNYGENRLAKMPSVIVEVGFHTNAEDAEALNDANFTIASMHGIAKGYRLFSEGKACEEFAAEVPSTATVDRDVLIVPVTVKGNPELPLTFDGKVASCDSQTCGSAHGVVFDESELQDASMTIVCPESAAAAPFTLRVVARDAAGIESMPAEMAVTCLHQEGSREAHRGA